MNTRTLRKEILDRINVENFGSRGFFVRKVKGGFWVGPNGAGGAKQREELCAALDDIGLPWECNGLPGTCGHHIIEVTYTE